MRNKLGILFLHHKINDVARQNLLSIKAHNPSATVVTMSAAEAFAGGYSLESTPRIKQIHAASPKKSSDWLVCSWFQQRREICTKWWIVEWDTYCSMSIRDYYRPVWEYPFVVSGVRLPNREADWGWFAHAKAFPKKFQPYITGGSPFIYLLDDSALKKICQTLLNSKLRTGNGELRFCTAANWCGYPPCGFSPPRDLITWIPLHGVPHYPGIFHPVKRLVRPAAV